jgi:beta-galactosidase
MLRSTENIPANDSITAIQLIPLSQPLLWSPETPHLYTVATRVFVEGRKTDETRTPIGVRTVGVAADRGFTLNGHPLNLVGGNVHHDNGPLGAAAFDRAEARRVQLLKEAGFNAVRTAHNPPSTAFLEACDRLGLLVIDEAFDGWAEKKTAHDYARVFDEWWPRDLQAMVLRDRNHPSVVMWSIGNEVYERGKPSGAALARAMREAVLKLDTSRPITAGINGLGKPGDWPRLDPLFASLDVAGYNYEAVRHVADHARLPSRVIVFSESYPSDTFACWQAVDAHSYVIGDFVWSAMDYLGEAGIGRVFAPGKQAIPHWEGNHYPWHGAACGDLDITGWRKPISHYRSIVWDRGEKLYAAVLVPSPASEPWSLSKWSVPPALPSWTWPGHEGRPLQVEVYSRHQAVRLHLNHHLVGEKATTRKEQFKAVFEVTYEPGTLRVAGVDGTREVEAFELETAGKPRSLQLIPDRDELRANGQDLAFVEVQIVDRHGNCRWDAANRVAYSIQGPGVIAGIGSGDLATTESYQANPRRVYQGRALVVIRSTAQPGNIVLSASSTGLKPARTTIRSE